MTLAIINPLLRLAGLDSDSKLVKAVEASVPSLSEGDLKTLESKISGLSVSLSPKLLKDLANSLSQIPKGTQVQAYVLVYQQDMKTYANNPKDRIKRGLKLLDLYGPPHNYPS